MATAWEAERVKADMVFVLRGSKCGATSRSGADLDNRKGYPSDGSDALFGGWRRASPRVSSRSSRPVPAPLVPTRTIAAASSSAASATSTDASFVGRWTRDGSRSVNAEAYLASHGLDEAKAAERAAAPYEQEWRETGAEEGEFLVLTDPGTGRGVRSLVYPIGEWEEEFKGSSELFGAEPGVVYRNTTYNEICTSDRCT